MSSLKFDSNPFKTLVFKIYNQGKNDFKSTSLDNNPFDKINETTLFYLWNKGFIDAKNEFLDFKQNINFLKVNVLLNSNLHTLNQRLDNYYWLDIQNNKISIFDIEYVYIQFENENDLNFFINILHTYNFYNFNQNNELILTFKFKNIFDYNKLLSILI